MRTIFIIILFTNMVLFINGQSMPAVNSNSNNKAKDLWEKLIEPKGGREKLYAVRNMLVSSTNYKDKSQTIKNSTERLIVFPNKEWQWDDDRPSVFGLRMTMYNWETGMQYIVQDKGDPNEWKLGTINPEEVKKSKNEDGVAKWAGLAIYLPETRWWKSIPLSVTEEKIGNKKVDVVQTKLFDKIIDFYLDKTTHLPLRIRFHNFISTRDVIDTNTLEISDYEEIAGIKVPMKLKEEDGGIYELKYKFNVEYDESIFTTPPSFEDGPEAWKKK